ncbi:MAG: alpha/beta hydrolase [Verrucomicrobiales bacterium]|jgi:acetyl esterase
MIKPLFLFLALAGMVLGAPQPDLVKIYKKVGGHELKLHIFNPDGHKAGDQRPAIVFFFGGGWNGGSPTQFYPQSEYLASRGMVAISAEYRVKNRHKTSPLECVKDGNSAIRWVRAHAGELGIDPKKIAAGGGSAGGHVAAAIGTTKGIVEEGEDPTVSSRPDALVLFNPVFDNGPKGYGHDRVKAYWKKISPFHNLDKTTPPTIVFLGTKDKLIPVATGEKYRDTMKGLGARCDLHLYDGEPHGFFNKSKYHETVFEADRFLASLGFLKGEPTIGHPLNGK